MADEAGKRRLDPRRTSLAKSPKEHTHIGLCLLFCGSAFRGLQLQAHSSTCHTLEGVLIQALRDASIIVDVVRGRPEGDQHHFARSCRTDRGVHAIRNMISLFIRTEALEAAGGLEGIREKLNAQLPAMVRVANVMFLTGSFIPRHCCNRRVYRYMIPLYALLPPCDNWAALEHHYPACLAAMQTLASECLAAGCTMHDVPFIDMTALPPKSFIPAVDVTGSTADTNATSWQADLQDRIVSCNGLLQAHFTGSRRYHNFSVDIDSNRAGVSAKVVQPYTDEALRVLYRTEILPRIFFFPCPSEEVESHHGTSWQEYQSNMKVAPNVAAPSPTAAAMKPQLPPGTHRLPFVFFQIEGGSFLLNMIRKVVGSLLAVCRGARASLLDEALSPEQRVTTPLAPGCYLYLAQSTYHGYDRGLNSHGGSRLMTVQDAWSGAVDEAAEEFAFNEIAADIVDSDLNLLPPLDDLLAARDRALVSRRPRTASEDTHLPEMKEYKPVLPTRGPWPASSEMTVFLRLLRVHNWNVRPIRLEPDCKALKEVRNRKERAAAASAAASFVDKKAPDASAGTTSSPEGQSDNGKEGHEAVSSSPNAGVPEGGTDGWLYLASSAEEARAQRQTYFAARWKRARPWEFAQVDGAECGGEDDMEEAKASGPSRHHSHRK